ncbi:calmodulin-regulated spectrin-associated protein 3-like isoform X2 [Phyllopteryx taeniolatus]|uniref:calmodulin-regulated spectrin-associated protein 3-like isoform X2 n=1 Tax=Phyllopteryx taeniolatus TaxID=161469 RepID=UPI002AD561E5|nr:calmodulin-regulated spectrin-associated protein 3-like isoform X2 [Phyllopteryx taeniolatus]
MVDSGPGEPTTTTTSTTRKSFSVPEIPPLDRCDFNRAKIRASVRWLLCKSYGCAENVPVELREPLYKDQYDQEHLKPALSKLLLSPEIYCRAQALLLQARGAPASALQDAPSDNCALLQFLTKKGVAPQVRDVGVREDDLSCTPIKMKAHLALMDSLMSLAAREIVDRVKMAAEAEQMGVGSPWENALLFWVNRLNQKLRESTEEDEMPKQSQPSADPQPSQETGPPTRWYWKLVPIRYRKDKVQSKLTPTFPLVTAVKDLSNGCAIAAVLHFYCPGLIPLEDVCLKDTMSVADSLYNLQLIKEFCESSLQSCCLLPLEDLLYAPPLLHLNIMSFVAELLEWFEIKKPDFVQPIQTIDLTDVSGLVFCTSPVSGNSNSGSPLFVFKQPFVTVPSLVSPENKSWTKKQISRPLSAVTFSIPFGLDSDVDIVMGNPIDSVFRSVSTDSLGAGIPATTSLAGMTRVPYSPPEDLSHLVSASAPSQRTSWGPYMHPAPLGELPTVEEALHVAPGGKDRKKERTEEKGGKVVLASRPEPRLCPEGAPAGFFLHSPLEDNPQLSSSAPCRSGVIYRPVGGEASSKGGRGERKERPSRATDMSRDDDSVLRDGSVDSSEASDDTPRNAPGNMRPSKSNQGHHSGNNSPRMTSFAERRDNRRRHPVASGEDFATTPTPTTPGTPHTPCTPAGTPSRVDSPGLKAPEPGSEAWELGARLEEKRKSIEAQKRRIEAIFVKHRQRLGKTAFLKMKQEQGEGGGEGTDEDNLSLEERLTNMEEQLKKEEDKEKTEKETDKEKAKTSVSNPTRLEKQVTFSIDSKKGQENEKVLDKERGEDGILVEYNEIVQKLSEALQSLQKDMQKLTEQQQQLLGNQRPRSSQKVTPKSKPKSNTKTPAKTPPPTPTKTPPRTPTKNPGMSTSKVWMIPTGPKTSSVSSPSRRTHALHAATSPKTIVSSSCPAPRTKINISSAPRSPKHQLRTQPHPRPSELKFPPVNRVLNPTHTVDTLPHLRRVSPSKCQVQTKSSFRIGGLQTPQEFSQPAPQPDDSTSDTASSETPTQFSLELEQDNAEAAIVPLPPHPRATSGSSSGAPSECSFESETLSISAACSTGQDRDRAGLAEKHCSMIEVSLSSLGGPEGGGDEPTDEGQDFSSDSMSDQLESAGEPGIVIASDTAEQLDSATEAGNPSDPQTESSEGQAKADALEPPGENNELGARGGIGFFFKGNVDNKEEMAQRKALLLERQQKRAEELKRRRQEQERDKRAESSEKTASSPSSTPHAGNASPSATPPATPARRGDFTRAEYARRQQLRIMDDLDKVLQQKSTNQGRSPVRKTRARPRSVTREESQLSLSPAKKATTPKMTKSHSSLNLAATDVSGNNDRDKKVQSRPDSPGGCVTPSRLAKQNGDWETGSNGTSPAPEYTGPKLFKEPSFKSNKFIIHNALSRCCLAGKVNESQKKKIVEEMEKSPANHFLILFRDASCQFRGVYTANPDSAKLVRLTGVGPKTISSAQVESMYKYSSDRKQFSAIPSKTLGMSVDAFTIPGHLWYGGGAAAAGGGGGGGGSRRASVTKKALASK